MLLRVTLQKNFGTNFDIYTGKAGVGKLSSRPISFINISQIDF